MKYKIINKTNCYIKYNKIVFTPNETKELELDNPYENENFHIEKLEIPEQIIKKNGGIKNGKFKRSME